MTDEYKETVMDQNKAAVANVESPQINLKSSITRAPTVEEAGRGNLSNDVPDGKETTVENNVCVEESQTETTEVVGHEGGHGESGISVSETVEEHATTKGKNLKFDAHLPRPKASKLNQLLALMCTPFQLILPSKSYPQYANMLTFYLPEKYYYYSYS